MEIKRGSLTLLNGYMNETVNAFAFKIARAISQFN
jgi:hypothetical protein